MTPKRALLAKERGEVERFPEDEPEELGAAISVVKGAPPGTARKLAEELPPTMRSRHTSMPNRGSTRTRRPTRGMPLSSALAFTLGSILPLFAILVGPAGVRLAITFRRGVGGLGDHRSGQRGPGWRPQGAGDPPGGGWGRDVAVAYGIGELVGTAGL